MSSTTSGLESETSFDEEVSYQVCIYTMQTQAAACQAAAPAYKIIFSDDSHANGEFFINPNLPRAPRLENLINAHASVFRRWTGFTLSEWELLSQRVCHIIHKYARAGHVKLHPGRKTKLGPAEGLLSFVLYVKHHSAARSNGIHWNYSRTSLNADGIFIASAINIALADKIHWLDATRRAQLARALLEFIGCIGFVNGTLCTIRRPRIDHQKFFYNNRKAKYCMNSVIIVDHDGFIICVDSGYPGSFHDVRCLKASHIHSH
jgi:hypothetical protein